MLPVVDIASSCLKAKWLCSGKTPRFAALCCRIKRLHFACLCDLNVKHFISDLYHTICFATAMRCPLLWDSNATSKSEHTGHQKQLLHWFPFRNSKYSSLTIELSRVA